MGCPPGNIDKELTRRKSESGDSGLLLGSQDLDFDIDLTGFSVDDILMDDVEGITDEDAVPDIPDEPVTKEGDIWILGNHRLMCGDSTSIDAVEKLMDGQKADMVFTDPPYGVDYDGGIQFKNGDPIAINGKNGETNG